MREQKSAGGSTPSTALALLILLAAPILSAQAITENPAKPKGPNAGRVVVPREVMAILDEGGDYYFKRPRNIRVAPNGAIFVQDENQLLMFDMNGRFERNLFRKGQGPGEMAFVGACLFTDARIIIQASSPFKLLWFDYGGRYEKEIPIRARARSVLTALLYWEGIIYLHSWSFPSGRAETEIVDVPQNILALDETSGEVRTLASFPTKASVISAPDGAGGMFPLASLIAVPFQQKYLALSHTSEYLLKIYDPSADKVVRQFRRAYKRVKADPLTAEQKKGTIMVGAKRYAPPEMKYRSDIKNLLVRGDEIWAVTSTGDGKKGVLVDVFDGQGSYQDCFYLQPPKSAQESIESPGKCTLLGDFLYLIEKTEEDTLVLRKYQIGSGTGR